MAARLKAAALALFAALGPFTLSAQAQSAANGQLLYTSAVVPGKLSCGSNACHGNLTSPQNRIGNGTSASAIQAATTRVSQMQFLAGQLGAAQYNDLAAYIAGKLGGAPSYLQVVAMPVPSTDVATLDFAAADLLTTTPTQTVTLTNAASASAPLTLGAITTTAGGDFAVTGGTCHSGDNLPVGASCTVLVAFTPTATGTRSATLNVVHNGATGASTVALSGVGTGSSPVITISPAALSFSQTVGGTSSDLRVLIANTGTGPLRLTALTLAGAQAAEFGMAAGSACVVGTQLAGGENCALALHFTPTGSGVRNATLTVAHNAAGGSSAIALTGYGNVTPQPGLMLDANRLDLGDQPIATRSAARVITLVNNGQAALQFTRLALSGTQAGEFALGGTCAVGTPVPAQGNCTLSITLAPADLGARTATLQIGSNAPSGDAAVSLMGTGVGAPASAVRLSQSALGFGTVAVGATSSPRTVVLSNAGNAPLALNSIASSSTEFVLTHDCPASLDPAASCSLTVRYAPAGPIASELLTVVSIAPSSPNRIVLNGVGSSSALAVFDWTEGGAPLAFADAAVGAATAPVLRTLVNHGPGAATVSTMAVTGPDAGSFVLGGGSCAIGGSLAAGASCTVGLRFAPPATGARTATLQVGTTGSNPAEIALSGTGSGFATPKAPLAVAPEALDYGQQPVLTGQHSDALIARIRNDGTSDNTLTAVTTSAGFVVSPAPGADACPGVPWTLAPGAACTVAVVFAPGTAGATSGTLTVTTSGGQSTKVALSGHATTVMTNVGGTGGGALDGRALLTLVLLVAALAAMRRRQTV